MPDGTTPSWVDVGSAAGPDGTLREARLGELLLGVARAEGVWHVFDATCTHAGCPLTDGSLEEGAVRCPCHGSRFDLATGSVLAGPATEPLTLLPVRVVGGRVEARVPAANAGGL
jgi:nitrite reductase/ring-hydroxylating ferredoxin subunit